VRARPIHDPHARLPWLIVVLTVVALVISVLAAWYVENHLFVAAWILVWLPMLGFLFWSTTRLRTEQAQTQEEYGHAAAAEANYRLLVEQARDIIYRTDRQGRFTFVNPTATRIMGYSEQELLGRRFIEFIRPDAREAAERFYGRQFMRKTPTTYYEFPAVAKDGREIWFGQNVQVLLEHGRATGFHAVTRDITDRKQTEAALAASERYLRTILEAEPECVKVTTEDGTLLNMNAAGLAMIEAESLNQVVGQSVYPLIAPAHRDAFAEFTRRVYRGESGTMQFEIVGLKGKRRWMDTHAVPLRNDHNVTTGVLAITHDITTRKQAEDRLLLSQEIIANAHDPISVLDLQGRFTYQNVSHASLIGFSDDELLGKTPALFLGDEAFASIRRELEKTQNYRGELVARTKNGALKNIDLSVFAVKDAADKPACFAAIKRDITERKREEKNVQALLEGTASVTGEPFFPVLVRALAGALGVRHAFVTELFDDGRPQLRILAIWSGDRLGSPAAYDLAHTPCENVIAQGEAFYQDSVQALFPRDTDLATLGAVGYLGIALTGSSGKTIGHLCIVDDKPLPGELRSAPLLRVFASRAAAELERKQTDDALRESEKRFRTIFDQAPLGMAVIDSITGQFRRINRTYCDIVGYSHKEMLARTFQNITHPDDLQADLDNMQRLLEGRIHTFQMEKRYIRKDGAIVWVNLTCVPLWWDFETEGRFHIAMVEDITERKRAEMEIQHTQNFLGSIVENIPDMIFVKEAENLRFVQFNKAGEDLLGHNRQNLIGRNDYDFFPKEEADFFTAKDRAVLKNKQLLDIPEEPIETKHRGRRILHTKKIPILDGEGRPQYLLGISEDITERKRAEEVREQLVSELAESRNRFEMFFRQTPSAIAITTVREGRFLDVNKQAEVLTGYPREELIGRTTLEMNLYVDPAERADVVQKLLETGVLTDLERQIRTKSGEIRTATFSLVPIQMGSEPCMLSIAHDITERKRAELFLAGEKRVLEMMSSGATLPAVLEAIARMVEEQRPGTLCSILLLDKSRKTLRHGAAPSLPPDYIRAVDGIAIGPAAGSYGTAAFLEKTVIVSDISSDPLWAACRDLALPYGLRACWAMPIFSSEKLVLGTFAQYYQAPQSPTDDDLRLVERFCHLAGIAIERAHGEEVLHDANLALRTLSRQLLQVQEDDRRTIARDLHDEIGQSLTAIKLNVERAQRTSDRDARARIMQDCAQITERVLDQVRDLSLNLHPSILDDLGLAYALQWYADRQAERAGLKVEVRTDPSLPRLSPDVEITCFRIAQEALTNVVRHAQAGQAVITLERRASAVELCIQDDGIGFVADRDSAPANGKASVGLTSMQERAKLIGGTVTIASAPRCGTKVIATLPLHAASPAGTPAEEVPRS